MNDFTDYILDACIEEQIIQGCVPKKLDINEVNNAIKIADVMLGDPIKFDWVTTLKKGTLTSKCGRVYLIVVDGEVKKIGGSCCKGGIKATLNFYKDGMKASPSIRSFGICYLIKQCLDSGSSVEIYMILAEGSKGSVKGLFAEDIRDINPFKEMEDKCKDDYKKIIGNYPDWNLQERRVRWSEEIQNAYLELKLKNQRKNE